MAETASQTTTDSCLWDVEACARFLGRSPRWVWAALRRRPDDAGSIPHVRVGKSPRFFPADIAEWVRQGCPPAAAYAEWKTDGDRSRKRPVNP